MGVLRVHAEVVGRKQIARERLPRFIRRRRQRDLRIGSRRQEDRRLCIIDHLLLVHDANRDCLVRAGLDARRRLAHRQPRGTHVAFADDAFAGVIFGHLVGAGHRAVLAAETLIVQVLDDPGDRILFVSIDRAGDHAGRLKTMVASGSDVLHHGRGARAANKQPDITPRFVVVQAVERMTRNDARLAAGAAVEVDFEGILLTGARRRSWQERAIPRAVRCVACVVRRYVRRIMQMPLAELIDSGERLLFIE